MQHETSTLPSRGSVLEKIPRHPADITKKRRRSRRAAIAALPPSILSKLAILQLNDPLLQSSLTQLHAEHGLGKWTRVFIFLESDLSRVVVVFLWMFGCFLTTVLEISADLERLSTHPLLQVGWSVKANNKDDDLISPITISSSEILKGRKKMLARNLEKVVKSFS